MQNDELKPVAWLHPAWLRGEFTEAYSPVTVYRVKGHVPLYTQPSVTAVAKAADTITALQAEVALLREALMPFASAARYLQRETEYEVCENLGAEHLINARKALENRHE